MHQITDAAGETVGVTRNRVQKSGERRRSARRNDGDVACASCGRADSEKVRLNDQRDLKYAKMRLNDIVLFRDPTLVRVRIGTVNFVRGNRKRLRCVMERV
jgi:hypothetical protein